ncbi:MAG: NAD(P)/FAD-dependent oxidoreductase [Proteobacteria bacterium]|nr:NAD(P)/FAD-dependent oxidoreductase [Pseudomonadota bacterium]MBU1583582.1 NAD(P)/FAD-dependent oxidoreductase [Pseudomonadota bacterium]MBU2453252.1 NAD(P)/FAD-dependent oxidoreductase [Pseudomonadota bacterium]MBU2627826.1 NAD(P)/FAD-dependent oxidoreductase [Pseudomonadota bacterium]
MYTNLFSPIKINRLDIKNRIAYPSLGLLYSYDTKLNDKYYNFYTEIAKGGAGIVTIGPVGIDFIGSGFVPLSLAKDEAIDSFIKATDMIKAQGASPWIQLFHGGAYTYPFLINNETPIAPSAVFSKYTKTTPKEMTLDDIRIVKEAFATAAERAKKSGFEGVEIIGSAGYLITQFLSPLTNIRTDDYGGSFENRTRFGRQIIEMIREKVGPDFPIGVRMAGNDFVPGSTTDDETPEIAVIYEKAGANIINVTGGWHESKIPQLPMELPRSGFSWLAMNIKKAVSIPVMASNRITTPDQAEQILRDGQADMVNLGRVLIADPFWPQKAKNGTPEEIRPCVACSQGCTDEIFSGRPVSCIGNVRAGFEGERRIEKCIHPKTVMVAGAGVAGLEAAVTAKKAGHRVEIYEKADDIGGQIWVAGAPPHKRELMEYVRYYRTMLKKHEIPIHLNTTVDLDLIKKINPDHLIIAQGAKPLVPPIKGADDLGVLSSWDVLKNSPFLGKNVAVIGGGAVGLETALFVAHKGTLSPEMLHFLVTYDALELERLKHYMFTGSSNVTVFEMLPKAGQDVGKSTKWILMNNLKRYGVHIKTNAKVLSIKDGLVEFETEGNKETALFDTVILASGSVPVQEIEKQIEPLGISFSTAGDCVKPGKLNDAIHGGFFAAKDI